MKTDKQYFIEACFSDNLQDFYREYLRENIAKVNHFKLPCGINVYQAIANKTILLEHWFWSPSNTCIKSGEKLTTENIDVHVGYWYPLWKPIHKDYAKKYKEDEVYACQSIDMNCNDCINFKRIEGNHGECTIKNNEKIITNPNACSPQNTNCFKHRKTI